MARRPDPPGQMALLDWTPPAPVARFAEEAVRAVSIADRMSRAVGAALRESPLERAEIARRMGEYLGAEISVNMLNGYASQGRKDHTISLVRFIALLHATGDRRLLEVVADLFGWTVIERRFLKMIELAAMQEQEDILRRQRKQLAREVKREGLL